MLKMEEEEKSGSADGEIEINMNPMEMEDVSTWNQLVFIATYYRFFLTSNSTKYKL